MIFIKEEFEEWCLKFEIPKIKQNELKSLVEKLFLTIEEKLIVPVEEVRGKCRKREFVHCRRFFGILLHSAVPELSYGAIMWWVGKNHCDFYHYVYSHRQDMRYDHYARKFRSVRVPFIIDVAILRKSGEHTLPYRKNGYSYSQIKKFLVGLGLENLLQNPSNAATKKSRRVKTVQ